MANIPGRIATAFTITEVLNEVRYLRQDLSEWDDEHTSSLWDVVKAAEELANGAWVRQLLNGPDVKSLSDDTLKNVVLRLQIDPLAVPGEHIYAATSGITTNLRGRVRDAETKANEKESSPQYVSFHNEALWNELLGEGVIDFLFRGSQKGFELRQCPALDCGQWFEPRLAGRGRFCSQDCRVKFNNMRQNQGKNKGEFKCAECDRTLSCEVFSGLETGHEGPSSLRLAPFKLNYYWERRPVCVACIAENHPEWKRYIEPFYNQPHKVVRRSKSEVKRPAKKMKGDRR